MRAAAGPGGLDQLRADSLRYGLLMRKFQIEAYRREVPYGGYVISVIRDIPNASMGLLDYLGQPKWTEADWAWHRDTMCLLKTESDRRSLFRRANGCAAKSCSVISAAKSSPMANSKSRWSRRIAGEVLQRRAAEGHPAEPRHARQPDGAGLAAAAGDGPSTSGPARRRCAPRKASFATNGRSGSFRAAPRTRPAKVRLHSSLSDEAAQRTLSRRAAARPERYRHGGSRGGGAIRRRSGAGARERRARAAAARRPEEQFPAQRTLVPARRALHPGACPHADRSRAICWSNSSTSTSPARSCPTSTTSRAIDPILMLWDTHDLKTVKTHGLIFETRAAKGRLLVSAVRHAGQENAAGRWLLQVLLDHLNSPATPKNALPDDVWAYLKNELHAERTNLVACTWRFKPDPKNEGLSQGWHQTEARLRRRLEGHPHRRDLGVARLSQSRWLGLVSPCRSRFRPAGRTRGLSVLRRRGRPLRAVRQRSNSPARAAIWPPARTPSTKRRATTSRGW